MTLKSGNSKSTTTLGSIKLNKAIIGDLSKSPENSKLQSGMKQQFSELFY